MRKLFAFAAVAVLLLAASSAPAAYWTGLAGTTSWSDTGNWDRNPAGDWIHLGDGNSWSTGSLNSATIVADGVTATVSELHIGATLGNNYTLTFQNNSALFYNANNGDLEIGGGMTNTLNGGTAGGKGTLILDHSTMTAMGRIDIGNGYNGLDIAGSGTLDVRNGSTMTIGRSSLLVNNETAYLNMGSPYTSAPNGDWTSAVVRIRGGSTMTFDKTNIGPGAQALLNFGTNGYILSPATLKQQILLGDSQGAGTINMIGTAMNSTSKIVEFRFADNGYVPDGSVYDSKIAGYGSLTVDSIGRRTGAYEWKYSIIADRNPANDADGGATGDKMLDLSGTPYYNMGHYEGPNDPAYSRYGAVGFFAKTHTALKFAVTSTDLSNGTSQAGVNKTYFPTNNVNNGNAWAGNGFINTASFTFATLNSGGATSSMQETLFAKDYAADPTVAGSNVSASDAISVFSFVKGAGLSFDNAQLTVDYDYTALGAHAAADLKVFYFNGTDWSTLDSTVATAGTPNITTAAGTITPDMLGADKLLVVGFTQPVPAPEPATMSLLVLGGIGALLRRKK